MTGTAWAGKHNSFGLIFGVFWGISGDVIHPMVCTVA